MATSDSELRAEVRDFTGIDSGIVSDEEFETVISDAKRHIKLRRSLTDEQTDWYNEPAQEEALNWATKLFLLVAAGELDSQSVSVGAIDDDTLLSKDDQETTIWYRNMNSALKRINPTATYGASSVGRREYGTGDTGSGDTNLGL